MQGRMMEKDSTNKLDKHPKQIVEDVKKGKERQDSEC